MKLFLYSVCVLLLGMSIPAMAQYQSGAWSKSLGIPILNGLDYVPETSVSFDKPDGRIVQAVFYSETVSEKEIEEFYTTVLYQLGWVQQNPFIYVREQEKLTMEISQGFSEKPQENNGLFVRFLLGPEKK